MYIHQKCVFGGLTAPSADQLAGMHDREAEMAATMRDHQQRISAMMEMMHRKRG